MTDDSELVALLEETGLRPRFDAKRLSHPTFLDATYNFAVLGLTITIIGKSELDGPDMAWTINIMTLRFCHFIATRPTLLRDFKLWVAKDIIGSQLDLTTWPLFPRGYLLDDTQLSAIDYLVARGDVSRTEKNVILRSSRSALSKMITKIEAEDLFQSERQTLKALRAMRITQTMLGV